MSFIRLLGLETKKTPVYIIPTQDQIKYNLRHTELKKPDGYKNTQHSSLRINVDKSTL